MTWALWVGDGVDIVRFEVWLCVVLRVGHSGICTL